MIVPLHTLACYAKVKVIVTPSIRELGLLEMMFHHLIILIPRRKAFLKLIKVMTGMLLSLPTRARKIIASMRTFTKERTLAKDFLEKSIHHSRMITDQPLVVRMDSGNYSLDNIKVLVKPENKVDFIIKRNLRKESPEVWFIVAQQHGICCLEREGKNACIGDLKFNAKSLIIHYGLYLKSLKELSRPMAKFY
ncbi:hypothetical protein [Thermincola potens]|uniref:hypothetical protein n=1 Tax=Thermincola potens TaxID=863643 RepID=UPI0002E174C9|nr:hypothetical protein [Thermincola potens]